MEETNQNTLREDIRIIQRDLEIIKRALLNDGKLTPWAKKQLAKARKEDPSLYTSLEEL
ncbi:MAG: hypothetical protein Q8Q31_00360 [Nanoarchaeota archaeon]|nr:hypothetical protein [Nanoarchaeota archaeon]